MISRKQKFGEWILDIAKYLVTIGILAPIFNLKDDFSFYYYVIVGCFAFGLTLYGLNLYDPRNKNKNNKKRR